MKKIIAAALMLILCVSLTGCFRWLTPPEDGPAPGTQTDEPDPSGGSSFDFSTTDLDGNTVTFADYSDSRLILLNLWAPWCGPCLGEMPDLQLLYEKYHEQGLEILGICGYDTEENARIAVEDTGVKYPILVFNDGFSWMETGYVPTSVFLDPEGNRLNGEDLIGSLSYEEWEALILEYLG